jgi:hypothetical protein
MLKYFIKRSDDKDFEEVSKDQYLFYQDMAGHNIGEGIVMDSFYDGILDLAGKTEGR